MGIDGHSHVIGQVRLLLGKRKRNNNYRNHENGMVMETDI